MGLKGSPVVLILIVGALGVATAFLVSFGGPGAVATLLTRVFGRLFG